MQRLINSIIKDHNGFTFSSGDTFVWSPHEQTISYDNKALSSMSGIWSLLHEIGHASLEHEEYHDDFELLIMEVQAWKEAKEIGKKYDIEIDDKYVEKSVDSYRDWLHKRSKCVECGVHTFQTSKTTYHCYNCKTKWKVPVSSVHHIRKTRIA